MQTDFECQNTDGTDAENINENDVDTSDDEDLIEDEQDILYRERNYFSVVTIMWNILFLLKESTLYFLFISITFSIYLCSSSNSSCLDLTFLTLAVFKSSNTRWKWKTVIMQVNVIIFNLFVIIVWVGFSC